jgi:ATP-dependent Lhr-like helicase
MIRDKDLQADRIIAQQIERSWYAFFSRFGRLTPVQRAAVPLLLEGRNILLCAATASGKTEAACAPLVERLLSRGGQGMILYVTPTRALVNDLFARLEGPASLLGLTIKRRTGESRMTLSPPPHLLITTPESLDSMLCRGGLSDEEGGHLLSKVEAVVLDEIHLLYGTPRGEQTKWLLERLKRLRLQAESKGWYYHSKVQLVGLSATVADPQAVLDQFMPDGQVVSISGSRLLKQESESSHSEKYSARPIQSILADYVIGLQQKEKILVFSNSRKRVDELTEYFRRHHTDTGFQMAAHHASLSKTLREETERAVRTEQRIIVFATSTLEIGVDIGDIDIVFLDGPAPDVASFLQRIGRGNRRSGMTRLCLCADTTKDQILQYAIIAAAEDGLLCVKPPGSQYGVLRQQLASYIYQAPRLRRGYAQIRSLFGTTLDDKRFRTLVDVMVRNGELREFPEGLLLGEYWREQATLGSIHSTIEGSAGNDVVDEKTGQKLAKGVLMQGGKGLHTGGRSLLVRRHVGQTIEVRQTNKDTFSTDGYNYASGGAIKSDSQALALRRYLGLSETDWPTHRLGDREYVFHLGGPRRAAFLKLYIEMVAPGVRQDVTEYRMSLVGLKREWFTSISVRAFQIEQQLSIELDRVENWLGRPLSNRKLPDPLRREELLSWLRLEEELAALATSQWLVTGQAEVLEYFV